MRFSSIRPRFPILAAAVIIILLPSCSGKGGSSDTTLTPSTATAPVISASGQPQNQTVIAGHTATFTVTATGTAPLAYQWKKDSAAIDGATGASYTTPVTITADSGATFTVTVSNSAANITSSAAILTVNPANTSDTTAPTVPANLSATAASATQVNLTWTASTDNVAVTGYRIYRGGTQIDTSTATSYSDTGLAASTAYSYTVAAYDAAGNLSAQCAPVQVTTMAPNSWASVINATPLIISQPATKAYPGIEYNVRLGVIGGYSRYTYDLDAAPSGMAISSNGTVTWTPAAGLNGQSFPVTIRVTDSQGQVVTQKFTLSVMTNGFFFIAPGGNDATGTGAMGSPWATINRGLASGSTGDTVYVRAGTYVQKWEFVTGKANRIVAYPGESPIADFDFESGPGVLDSGTQVDGFEIRNILFKAFQVGGGLDNLTFRRNHMHHLYDNSVSENPSFIFFWDENPKQYSQIIIQENTFHDLFDRASGLHGDTSANYHGGSSVWYNVSTSLYEDNEAYNIDGSGMKDKDDGYKNTFRGNHFHHNYEGGLGLMNQNTEDGAEVAYNRFDGSGLAVGWQPGYIRNVDIHHNTFYGANIYYRWVLGSSESYNFTTRDNIFANLASFAYSSEGVETAAKLFGSSSPFDHNLIQTTSTWIFGFDWGPTPKITFADWQTTYQKDLHSQSADPLLIDPANGNFSPASNSPARGAASDGSDIGALPCQR